MSFIKFKYIQLGQEINFHFHYQNQLILHVKISVAIGTSLPANYNLHCMIFALKLILLKTSIPLDF